MKSEFIQVGQIGIQFLLQAADTNGAIAMFEFTVPVGAKMPVPINMNVMTRRSTVWRAW